METLSRFIIVITCLLLSACVTHKDIPLTEGSIPYPLKPGIYEDIHGKTYNEKNIRWSISEADLFRDTQQLSKETSKKEQLFLTLKNNVQFIILLLIVILLFKTKNTK